MNRRDLNLALAASFASLVGGCTSHLSEQDRADGSLAPGQLGTDLAQKQITAEAPVLIRVFKDESEFEVWKQDSSGQFALLRNIPNCRWSGRLGPKLAHGDGQAPEGVYAFNSAMIDPIGRKRRSINLGYPNRLETALGYTGKAVIAQGECASDGCIAFDDESGPEIFTIAEAALKSGQQEVQVQVYPFRMTLANLVKRRDSPNVRFWANLKLGSDIFEATRQPLNVSFCGGEYQFNAKYEGGAASNPLADCPVRVDIEDPAVAANRKRTSEALNFFKPSKSSTAANS